MSEAIVTGAAFAQEFRVRRKDNGELRFLCHEGRVVERDLSGAATILAGASHDVTERRLKQEASELLNRELSHRIKNVLSVVGNLATMSGEHRPETSAYIAAFQARLNNLAAAHDLLIRPNGSGRARRARRKDARFDRRARSRRSAASGLVVGLHDTQTVALVLHELGTNATKHGRCRTATGASPCALSCGRSQAARDPRRSSSSGRKRAAPKWSLPSAKASASILLERLARRQEPDAPVLDWAPPACAATSRCALTPPRLKPESSAETPA
jgi:hypothetical protein